MPQDRTSGGLLLRQIGLLDCRRKRLGCSRNSWARGRSHWPISPAKRRLWHKSNRLCRPSKSKCSRRGILWSPCPDISLGKDWPERFRFSGLHLSKDLSVSLPSEVIQQRSDVRAAETKLHAATAEVGWPSPSDRRGSIQQANAGATGAVQSNLASLSSPVSAFWALAANASQVPFDGFSRAQRQRAAEAGLDEAAAQYRSTVIGAFRNVADALEAVEATARVMRVETG
jgi:Outer membrane efflux protein